MVCVHLPRPVAAVGGAEHVIARSPTPGHWLAAAALSRAACWSVLVGAILRRPHRDDAPREAREGVERRGLSRRHAEATASGAGAVPYARPGRARIGRRLSSCRARRLRSDQVISAPCRTGMPIGNGNRAMSIRRTQTALLDEVPDTLGDRAPPRARRWSAEHDAWRDAAEEAAGALAPGGSQRTARRPTPPTAPPRTARTRPRTRCAQTQTSRTSVS